MDWQANLITSHAEVVALLRGTTVGSRFSAFARSVMQVVRHSTFLPPWRRRVWRSCRSGLRA